MICAYIYDVWSARHQSCIARDTRMSCLREGNLELIRARFKKARQTSICFMYKCIEKCEHIEMTRLMHTVHVHCIYIYVYNITSLRISLYIYQYSSTCMCAYIYIFTHTCMCTHICILFTYYTQKHIRKI